MALHPEFPSSPYEPLLAEHRWFPAAEELRTTAYEKLLPPISFGNDTMTLLPVNVG